MRCVIFFDTLPKGFGDSFVAPHLLPGTNCIMNPERMPVSAPSNECPRCVVKWMTLKRGGSRLPGSNLDRKNRNICLRKLGFRLLGKKVFFF